jgi:hypothetical protein
MYGTGTYINHRKWLKYEKYGPELYCYAQNNILKNNFAKNASPRAEVHLQFSVQLIEALIGGENFFSSKKKVMSVIKRSVFLSRFQKYKIALVTKCT